MTERYFQLATHQAIKSDMHKKHGSVLVKNGKIISTGFNHYRTRVSLTDSNICSIHSELHCLLRSGLTNPCSLSGSKKRFERDKVVQHQIVCS